MVRSVISKCRERYFLWVSDSIFSWYSLKYFPAAMKLLSIQNIAMTTSGTTPLQPDYRSMAGEQAFWRSEICWQASQPTTSVASPFPFPHHSPEPWPRHLPALQILPSPESRDCLTCDHRIKQQEFSQFATMFRQQRVRLRYSAKKVGLDVRCSRSTILSFEDLKLSLRSMRKWKQHLQSWLRMVAKKTQVMIFVPNRAAQSMKAPLLARQPALDPEALEKDKAPWRPWRPWSPEVAEGDMTQNSNKDDGSQMLKDLSK